MFWRAVQWLLRVWSDRQEDRAQRALWQHLSESRLDAWFGEEEDRR